MKPLYLLMLALLGGWPLWATAQTVGQPLPHTHAHNDYWHTRPLWDALQAGFVSIEADVYARKGVLRVAHWPWEIKKDRELEGMYLKPLYELYQKQGSIYPGRTEPLILLVDFKSGYKKTYPILLKLLEKHRAMLTVFKGKVVLPGAVTVVLTGLRPPDTSYFNGVTERLVGLDIQKNLDPSDAGLAYWHPMCSLSYGRKNWDGNGEPPAEVVARIETFVALSQACGCQSRVYAMPESPALWKWLLGMGVGLINTDDLQLLQETLNNKK